MADGQLLSVRGELDEPMLVEFLREQRWFGARTREIKGANTVDVVGLSEEPQWAVALVDVHFETGTHDLYQLLLEWRDGELFDAGGDPEFGRRLVDLASRNEAVTGTAGQLTLGSIRPIEHMDDVRVRALDHDQSNTSMVVGDLIVKTYRRIEPGVNPELEMLLFFAEHGFVRVPELAGWYGYEGDRVQATLGVAQRFLPDAVDGWTLYLDNATGDPERFLTLAEQLGTVVGEMHGVLASDTADPAFAPEDPTPESAALLVARIDEEISGIFDELVDREEMGPLAGRRDDAHMLLGALGSSLAPGRNIRVHGDLHLGQVLWDRDDWSIIDFEGEPVRPLSDRRQKALPLRDVAGLLRSFSYLTSALARREDPLPDDWEEQARERVLLGYRATAAAAVLPAALEAQERQLRMFELEKACYELRYEIEHRPDWVDIPVRSILTMLERGAL
jgi:maltokinase